MQFLMAYYGECDIYSCTLKINYNYYILIIYKLTFYYFIITNKQ
jgi:hypothetical protein